jgi:hypothetical protein
MVELWLSYFLSFAANLSSDPYSAVCRAVLGVPDRGGLRHKIAAQVVDALSDGCNNWFYDISALIFYFYHMEITAERELTAPEE